MNRFDTTVAALVDARRSGQPQPAPEVADAAEAYAVQRGVARALGWFAAGPAGHWKSGGPSRETATHAPLPTAGVLRSPADARALALHHRGIEAEVALRLNQAVDADRAAVLDDASAAALVEAMCVSIEIIDSRWREAFDAPPLARLADLQLHGALVLGEWTAFAARDWSSQRCVLRIGNASARTFIGTHSLGNPVAVLPGWLRHATAGGEVLVAGSVVTTGTWCGVEHAQVGDAVEVHFDGIGDARVQF